MTIINATRKRMAVGLLVAAGLAVASASPALADRKHKNWHHDHGKHNGYRHDEVRYYDGPDVIYVQPRPVYVRERVYVQPAPVYYEPAPVIYQRPSINIVVPLFD
jgi:hypothetical protein